MQEDCCHIFDSSHTGEEMTQATIIEHFQKAIADKKLELEVLQIKYEDYRKSQTEQHSSPVPVVRSQECP